MIINNKNDLEKLLQKLNRNIGSAMNNEVNKETRDTMKEQIQETVYDVYSPTLYERQKDNGGLIDDDNIKTTLIDNTTLIVENIRSDDGVNVAEVVESGQGYKFDFPYNGVPRPFSAATREQLENTGAHKHALYKGLKRQGIDVEVK